ncbi:MAG: Rossmann-like domain-containing protein [Desulfobacteraceae bacterium]
MKILDDIISTLDFNAPLKDIRQGVFHTAVLSRYCGLAASLPRDALKQTPPLVKEAGALLDKTTEQLVRMAYSKSVLEAAIGMAAVNSLLEVDVDACEELNAAELILRRGEGKRVAIVGHFPFIPRIREKAGELWVIEKNPKGEDFTEEDAERLIPRAEVVAVTGTALTNHTLQDLLGRCAPGAYVLMLGDTVPLSPVLFDYGVDALCGTRVLDSDLALNCVSQGANFRQIKGVKRLTLIKDQTPVNWT